MKRSPLKRKKPMRRGAKKSKYARRERAFPYMQLVRMQPCIIESALDALLRAAGIATGVDAKHIRCSGPIEANHAGERIAGHGTKALDRTCIAQCREHHRHWTEYSGIFSGFTHGQRRSFADAAIELMHCRARLLGVEVPTC